MSSAVVSSAAARWPRVYERPIDVSKRRRGPGGSEWVADHLRQLGLQANVVPDRVLEPSAGRIVWLHGNVLWHPHTVRRLAQFAPGSRPVTLLWHTEPLELPRAAGFPRPRLHARELAKIALRDDRRTDPYSNMRSLTRVTADGLLDVVGVSTGGGVESLRQRGIEAALVPLAYEPSRGRDLGLERYIDVLFLGIANIPRRRRILKQLRRAEVAVEAVGRWDDPRYMGEPRTRLLNRTKILLNIPRHPGLLSGGRMVLGMANKALVVAEPIWRPEPYRPGVHYVSAEIEEMPAVIDHYLGDEAARREIVDAAYDFVMTEHLAQRSLASILDLAEQVLARS